MASIVSGQDGDGLATRLSRYAITAEQVGRLEARFQRAAASCQFVREGDVLAAVERFKGIPGIYFWLLCSGTSRFKIYLGQTTSLSYRLTNYISDFQPHAPNDFKLRIFHEFVAEQLPTAVFQLYFQPIDFGSASLSEVRAGLTEAENAEIRSFAPILLNDRSRPSREAKDLLRRAFTEFYRSGFESLLGTP